MAVVIHPGSAPTYSPVYNPNPGGRLSPQYPGPVNRTDNTQIKPSTNIGGFNELMMKMTEFYDPFLQAYTMETPRWWHDRIPRGVFQLNHGTVHETRIFRGGLHKMAGLQEWKMLDPVPSVDNDPCHYDGYTTDPYAWEAMSWSPWTRVWGTDPICSKSFRFIEDASTQLGYILQNAIEQGVSIQEIWNRDNYIKASVDRGRSFVMSSAYDGSEHFARYFYNPYAKVPKGFEQPVIVIDASVEMEPLNFDVLDKVRASLTVRCQPGQALSQGAGGKMFGLPISVDDVDSYIRGNERDRMLWQEAQPQALINYYGLETRVFRRWMIMDDLNQMRFKIRRYEESYNPATYSNVAPELTGKPVYVAEYVPPRRLGRLGLEGTRVPEDNPDYVNAEIAIVPIFMNQILTNLFVPEGPTSYGFGTHFGAVTGLNGSLQWLNILDKEKNPFGEIGNFFGKFEIAPKPEPGVFNAISFVYRRCTQNLKSLCPIQNPKVNIDPKVPAGAKTKVKASYGPDMIGAQGKPVALGAKFTLILDNDTALDVGDEVELIDKSGDPTYDTPLVVLSKISGNTVEVLVTGVGTHHQLSYPAGDTDTTDITSALAGATLQPRSAAVAAAAAVTPGPEAGTTA